MSSLPVEQNYLLALGRRCKGDNLQKHYKHPTATSYYCLLDGGTSEVPDSSFPLLRIIWLLFVLVPKYGRLVGEVQLVYFFVCVLGLIYHCVFYPAEVLLLPLDSVHESIMGGEAVFVYIKKGRSVF